jgi:hypothetical protein
LLLSQPINDPTLFSRVSSLSDRCGPEFVDIGVVSLFQTHQELIEQSVELFGVIDKECSPGSESPPRLWQFSTT